LTVTIDAKIKRHEAFWRGEGSSLILIPAEAQDLYDLHNYPERFHNPRAMWESEICRARPVIDWPTDGIPCVRPNLGVIFVPAVAGLGYRLPEAAMPWPGEPLAREAIRAAALENMGKSETMLLAEAFYDIHDESDEKEIVAYQADTQGVFDIAHLLYGEELFYELADPGAREWIGELLDISREFYVQATLCMKKWLGEPANSMIHGHGTSQGVFFPDAGVRSSEDTVTLISPTMIEEHILPQIQRTTERLGGIFTHFCGKHPTLLDQLCGLNTVRAIDLGNPEYHDTREVMKTCAKTGTVLYSRIAAELGENWQGYMQRLAGLVRETGARVILRPLVTPATREESEEMLHFWHENT
jgi:hypothetical protein